jgi:hypothetical protein
MRPILSKNLYFWSNLDLSKRAMLSQSKCLSRDHSQLLYHNNVCAVKPPIGVHQMEAKLLIQYSGSRR